MDKPLLKTLEDSSKVVTFKVRNIRDYIVKKYEGVKVKNRMYHEETRYNCVAWNEKAEEVDMMFNEGDKVWIKGYMRDSKLKKDDKTIITKQFVVDECGKL